MKTNWATEKKSLFRDTVARRRPEGGWMLMNHPEKGWASYGIEYNTTLEIFQDFDITFGPLQSDSCSEFVPVKVRR